MSEIVVSSGATVKINPAPWGDTMALKAAIGKELAGSDLKAFKMDMSVKLTEQDFNLADLAQVALSIDSSPAVYKALFACLGRCTYNGQRITEQTFEDENARQDYYEIVIECLRVNLSPFFKGLLSKLSPFLKRAEGQTQESPESK